jgi:hypothetical protein
MNSGVTAGDRRALAAEIEKRIGAANKYTPKGRVSFRNLRLKTADEIRGDRSCASVRENAYNRGWATYPTPLHLWATPAELCVNLDDGLFTIDQAASLWLASMPSAI